MAISCEITQEFPGQQSSESKLKLQSRDSSPRPSVIPLGRNRASGSFKIGQVAASDNVDQNASGTLEVLSNASQAQDNATSQDGLEDPLHSG